MEFLAKYAVLILGAALGLSLIALGISRYQIVGLEGKLALSEQQKQEALDNNKIFVEKLRRQNDEVDNLKNEAQKNKTKYEEVILRMKPEIEKREERIKVIDRVQVTSNECTDVLNIIDAARGNHG